VCAKRATQTLLYAYFLILFIVLAFIDLSFAISIGATAEPYSYSSSYL